MSIEKEVIEKEVIEKEVIEKVEKTDESKNFYDSILNGYNDLEIEEPKNFESNSIEQEEKKESKGSTKKIKPEKISLLDSGVTPAMGVQGINLLMSTISPFIYNMLSKEHKTNSEDWSLNQNEMNILAVPVKMLLEAIKIEPTNPYLATLGALVFVYGNKTIEIKNAHKNGVKMSKPATAPNLNTTGKKVYVRKWLDKANGVMNPEHKDFKG